MGELVSIPLLWLNISTNNPNISLRHRYSQAAWSPCTLPPNVGPCTLVLSVFDVVGHICVKFLFLPHTETHFSDCSGERNDAEFPGQGEKL